MTHPAMSSLPPNEAAASAVDEGDGAHTAALRGWLLALLRLAVTHDDMDRAEVLAAARGLDRLRTPKGAASSFRFFADLSATLCAAIIDATRPDRRDILRRHIGRIADLRLRRAFAAAVDIEPATATDRSPTPANRTAPQRSSGGRAAPPRAALWRGLG